MYWNVSRIINICRKALKGYLSCDKLDSLSSSMKPFLGGKACLMSFPPFPGIRESPISTVIWAASPYFFDFSSLLKLLKSSMANN